MNNARNTTRRLLLASVFAVFLLLSPILVSPALADLGGDPGGPYEGVVGENVQFQATAFSDGGRIVEYRWDFGDGTSVSRPGPTVNHKYLFADTLTVSLIVVDIDGLTSTPAMTTAAIVESTTTTTSPTTTTTPPPTTTTTSPTSTTSTTGTTSPTTTTTTPPPTTTTTSPTSTTSTTGTTTTSTTTSPATTRPTTSTTTNTSPTSTTTVTADGLVAPAEGLSATAFSLVPPAVPAGGEIALTVLLSAEIPGLADLLFLLDGRPLGEMVSVNTAIESTGSGVGAVFTRTLPTNLKSGSYLVEVATQQRPSVVLASTTITVLAGLPVAVDQLVKASPPPKESTMPDSTVALAAGGAAVVVGAGFGFSARYRRKTIVRRIGNTDP